MHRFILLFALLLPLCLSAQSFGKVINDDLTCHIDAFEILPNGNLLVSGRSAEKIRYTKAFLRCYTPDLQLLWEHPVADFFAGDKHPIHIFEDLIYFLPSTWSCDLGSSYYPVVLDQQGNVIYETPYGPNSSGNRIQAGFPLQLKDGGIFSFQYYFGNSITFSISWKDMITNDTLAYTNINDSHIYEHTRDYFLVSDSAILIYGTNDYPNNFQCSLIKFPHGWRNYSLFDGTFSQPLPFEFDVELQEILPVPNSDNRFVSYADASLQTWTLSGDYQESASGLFGQIIDVKTTASLAYCLSEQAGVHKISIIQLSDLSLIQEISLAGTGSRFVPNLLVQDEAAIYVSGHQFSEIWDNNTDFEAPVKSEAFIYRIDREQPALPNTPFTDLAITSVTNTWQLSFRQGDVSIFLLDSMYHSTRDLYNVSSAGFEVTIKNTGNETINQFDFNANFHRPFSYGICRRFNESFHQRFTGLDLSPGASVTLTTESYDPAVLLLSDPLPGCYWPSAPNLGIDDNPENDIFCTTHAVEVNPWQIVNSQETLLTYDARNRVINANVDIRDPQNAESIFQLTIVNTLGQPILREPNFEVEFRANYRPNLQPGTYVAILTRDGEIVDRMQFLYF